MPYIFVVVEKIEKCLPSPIKTAVGNICLCSWFVSLRHMQHHAMHEKPLSSRPSKKRQRIISTINGILCHALGLIFISFPLHCKHAYIKCPPSTSLLVETHNIFSNCGNWPKKRSNLIIQVESSSIKVFLKSTTVLWLSVFHLTYPIYKGSLTFSSSLFFYLKL